MSLREDAKKIYSSSIAKLDPSRTVYDYLSSNSIIDSHFEKIYPVAFGKASISMMSGLLDYLKDQFPKIPIHEKPVIISNNSQETIEHNVDLHFSSHPVPTEKSVAAGDKVINYISSSSDKDLVIFLISGGASALLSKPPSTIALEDKITLTDLLLKSGASINEMNTVRKHMSDIKGGRLTKFAEPSSCYSLIISDVINDDISSIASGPTTHDKTTYKDAENILNSYNLLDKTPLSILNHINKGVSGEIEESPKDIINCDNKIISSNRLYREQLASFAKKSGYTPILIPRDIIGEAKEEAFFLIEQINEHTVNTSDKPLAIISGGETVVNMQGSGLGGRNQELALSFLANSKKINTQREWLLLSVGTDGIDGPTNAAGGIIDNTSVKCMMESNKDINNFLSNNDSYNYLKEINSLYITGPSGTNVADVQLILVR